MELLKLITLSSKENTAVIDQNILMYLLAIRGKFVSHEQITKRNDEIANELMKSHEKNDEAVIRDVIKEFHQKVQKNFNDEENNKNEETINSFNKNKNTVNQF